MDDSREALRTVRDLIRYGVSRFNQTKLSFGHGSDNAWDEAVYLVLSALHLPPDQLEPFMDAHVLPEERQKALQHIDARCERRVPASYLTHEAWLQGYTFYVDERVIVPRSPFAELITRGFAPWIDPARVLRVEHPLLLSVLQMAASGRIAEQAGQATLDGQPLFTPLRLEFPDS